MADAEVTFRDRPRMWPTALPQTSMGLPSLIEATGIVEGCKRGGLVVSAVTTMMTAVKKALGFGFMLRYARDKLNILELEHSSSFHILEELDDTHLPKPLRHQVAPLLPSEDVLYVFHCRHWGDGVWD